MDERHRAMLVFFLLCFIGDMPAEGHSLDVCATCHANATCDDKSDGSGKVCNCKYGFVGNGRTFCQDKDECQIGASRICGPHTTCHNTYGSYYCKCLSGYSPSNNMDVFIPNDGTHCQDVDECRMTGLCGEGGQCRNLEGSVDCSCRLGYQVHNGAEPFHPVEDRASCKVVDCGQRTSVDDTVLLSVTGTTYGSVAMFVCDEGLVWRSGDNSSVCGADGLWRGADMVCEEVDCGSPPALPHSLMLWNKSSRMGTEVLYQCNSGYHNVGKGNVSICTPAGQWEKPSVLCQETLCGSPPIIESTEQVWDSNSTPGSTVLYVCKKGFYNKGGHNVSICNEDGQWTPTTLFCREILCGDPPILPHTGQVWNGSSTAGSTLTYYCKIGFYHNEGSNMSLCTINGYWTKPNISCKEVDCGEPPPIPHSVMLWDNISTVGSQVVYQCNSGYGRVGEGNVSVCTASGEWDGASLLCQEINCQEPVFKPHAKMLWDGTSHIGSVVHYQCEEGYYTGSLRNYSVCGENGLWEDIDLCCEEVSCGPPLTLPHTNLRWDGTSRPGSVVLYECTEGFYQERETNISTCLLSGQWGEVSVKCKAKCGPAPFLANSEVMWHNRSVVIHRCVDGYHSWRGSNVSVCGSSGVWQTATLRCIEILCGDPPILPHTGQVWNGSSTAGSTLTYYCKIGFYHNEGSNMSLCTINGYWTKPNISCKEVDCGEPPPIPHSVMLWDNISTVGSQVVYQCNSGYGRVGEGNVSVCTASGEWDGASLLCQEINCQEPVFKPHAKMLWDGTSHIGSVVHYQCEEGYYTGSLRNYSVCGENGLWEDIDLCCEEVSCGPPLTLPHTNLRWDGTSRPGSVVLYECTEGFYQERETNISTCLLSGQWGEVSVKCKAKCGPAPFLANSEVMWHNRSVVIHRCVDGYHSWRGSNVSVCGSSGVWQTATLRCIEILCGDPPILPHTGQVWNGSSTAGSTLTYYCKIGFYHNEGSNMSLCTINGYWTKPNISCKEVDCGEPPPIPHSVMLWDNISTVGSQVVYQCNSGYGRVGEGNVSVCTASGEWDGASLLCQEINCQEPVFKPHAKMLWDGTSHIGSVVHYQCEEGYYTGSLRNYSVCGENGLWEDIDLCCEEISCGPPLTLPHTNLRWDGTSRPGSVVLYECTEGFYQERETNISTCLLSGQWGEVSVKCKAKCGPVPFLANSEVMWQNRSMVIHRCVDGYHSWRGSNVSVCGSSGVWQTATLRCIEVSCGPPLTLPHTNLRWDGTSRPGSVVLYECTEGFYQERETNISTCLLSGQWGEVSVKCKAKCGPVPFLANSEVIWHNRSMVIHRCVDGYHSWRGSNVSVCGSSGVWQTATLRCIEIKPPVSHLVVLNEKCLHWRAEKHEEDTEVYKVTYIGSRDYQSSFHDTRKQFLSSKADQLELCLNLLPVTNYSISIIAVSSRFTITITTNTSLPVPPAPVVYYREFEIPVPTLRLRRSPNTLDPISLYQVFVLPVEGIMMFDCSSPASSGPSSKIKSSTEYITAQIDVRHVGTEMNFTVGDGLDYGGFFNAPLENGRNYYIILRAVSQWKSALKSSCVLWAKVRDTSYVLRVSSLVAAASIGLVALVILGRYSFTWFLKRTRHS